MLLTILRGWLTLICLRKAKCLNVNFGNDEHDEHNDKSFMFVWECRTSIPKRQRILAVSTASLLIESIENECASSVIWSCLKWLADLEISRYDLLLELSRTFLMLGFDSRYCPITCSDCCNIGGQRPLRQTDVTQSRPRFLHLWAVRSHLCHKDWW